MNEDIQKLGFRESRKNTEVSGILPRVVGRVPDILLEDAGNILGIFWRIFKVFKYF